MCVYAPDPAKPSSAKGIFFKHRYNNLLFRADNNILNKTLTACNDADLTIYLSGNLCNISGKFRCDELRRRDSAVINPLNSFYLICLKTSCVSVYDRDALNLQSKLEFTNKSYYDKKVVSINFYRGFKCH